MSSLDSCVDIFGDKAESQPSILFPSVDKVVNPGFLSSKKIRVRTLAICS